MHFNLRIFSDIIFLQIASFTHKDFLRNKYLENIYSCAVATDFFRFLQSTFQDVLIPEFIPQVMKYATFKSIIHT